MKAKLFIKTVILIFLVSCGYKPILQTKDVNFSISSIELQGIDKINFKIKNNLKKYFNAENKPRFYQVKVFSKKQRTVASKDDKGNPTIFQLELLVKFEVFENNDLKDEKIFIESFKYNNASKKFELSEYEKSVEENLINKILERINLFLNTM